jgi:hypothetical protein
MAVSKLLELERAREDIASMFDGPAWILAVVFADLNQRTLLNDNLHCIISQIGVFHRACVHAAWTHDLYHGSTITTSDSAPLI